MILLVKDCKNATVKTYSFVNVSYGEKLYTVKLKNYIL